MALTLVHSSSILNEEKNLIDENKKVTPEPTTIAPVYQDTVFIIMWPSNRSGGTYSDLRKSEAGKNRFVETLEFMGVDISTVQVIEQTKPWVPTPKSKDKKKKEKKGRKPYGKRTTLHWWRKTSYF